MILEHTGGEIELRINDEAIDQTVARNPQTTPAGQLVLIGDGGWDPATLTLRARITSNTTGTPGDGAMTTAETLLAAAKNALSLREPGDPLTARITYLYGLAHTVRRNRGTWWELELTFRPRALDGTRGTGEVVTYLGDVVTHLTIPVTTEVH